MTHSIAVKPGEPGFDLALNVCFSFALLLLVGLSYLLWRSLRRTRRQHEAERRGFEVKQNSGETPMTSDKERD